MTHTLLDLRRVASRANARFCSDNAPESGDFSPGATQTRMVEGLDKDVMESLRASILKDAWRRWMRSCRPACSWPPTRRAISSGNA
jgi:hypothetical protein